jgi:chaperone BCS1
MFEFLKHVLGGQNQFASGGLLLMVMGAIGVFLRALPKMFWGWIVDQSTMTITVTDDDTAFRWMKEWFLEQQFLKRVRQLALDTTLRGREIALIPAPGVHYFWYGKRPFQVWFHRSDDASGRSQRRVESLTFQTIGRDQRFLRKFVGEVVECHRRKEKMASILYVWSDYWTSVEAYAPRWIESVILKAGEKEHLMQDIERFRASRARYQRLGVPYHRGYLLYGPPGTGKTSLVSALAAKFGMSIYAINLTEFNDRTLKSAMNEVAENSVVLFEDIDCMRTGDRRPDGRQRSEQQESKEDKKSSADQSGVTLSGLLNVLDGFHAPENVIFMMTTNKEETLDPALLRPGRIDYRLFLGGAHESQRTELYRRFFPEATDAEARDFVQAHSAETMAEFQGLLLALEQMNPEWVELDLAAIGE